MITHVDIITLFVRDQKQAVDFFTKTLGFEKRMDTPFNPEERWVTVAPKGAQTQIVLLKEGGPSCPPAARAGVHTQWVFQTDDMDKTYKELAAKGVAFTERPSAQPWGKQAQFADPDGNVFVLVESPKS